MFALSCTVLFILVHLVLSLRSCPRFRNSVVSHLQNLSLNQILILLRWDCKGMFPFLILKYFNLHLHQVLWTILTFVLRSITSMELQLHWNIEVVHRNPNFHYHLDHTISIFSRLPQLFLYFKLSALTEKNSAKKCPASIPAILCFYFQSSLKSFIYYFLIMILDFNYFH